MRSDMVPGATLPDYELTDHTAKHRKLSELQGQDPMVLVLGRGGFCPKDRRQAEGLLQLHREMEVGYCRLVTITTNNITQTNENRSGIGAHWPFLSDPRRVVQKDLDIAEYTDPVHNPMVPHVIVLEPGLVVHKIYNGYWFFGRPTVEELRQDLRAVSKKCRPDWDITTPELKAAWQAGPQGLVLSVRQDLPSNFRRTGLRADAKFALEQDQGHEVTALLGNCSSKPPHTRRPTRRKSRVVVRRAFNPGASHSYIDMTGLFRTSDGKVRICVPLSDEETQ